MPSRFWCSTPGRATSDSGGRAIGRSTDDRTGDDTTPRLFWGFSTSSTLGRTDVSPPALPNGVMFERRAALRARFAAGFVSGEGLTPAAREEIVRPQLPITTRSQFPTLQAELPAARKNIAGKAAVTPADEKARACEQMLGGI